MTKDISWQDKFFFALSYSLRQFEILSILEENEKRDVGRREIQGLPGLDLQPVGCDHFKSRPVAHARASERVTCARE